MTEMTGRAREVVFYAEAAARQCRTPSIDAPHLLLGLLCRPDTAGCQALNTAGLHHREVLLEVEAMNEQAPAEPSAQSMFTVEAKALLTGWEREARDRGNRFVETAHLALACSRPGRVPSLQPFVAGREQAVRDAALAALRRPRVRSENPGRDDPSCMAALMRADQIRTQRAQLKRELRTGQRSIRYLLPHPPDYVSTAKVCDILLALPPTYGRARIDKVLALCGISRSKTFEGLSQRQRDQLATLLTAET